MTTFSATIVVHDDKEVVLETNDPDIQSEADFEAVCIHGKFTAWLKQLTSTVQIEKVQILKVSWFSKANRNLGFIYVNAKRVGNGNNHFAFIRGNAVAAYMELIVEETNKKYVLFTEQYRVPVGKICFEIPAGMMDEGTLGGTTIATMVKEIKEETGIDRITEADLHSLGAPIMPSPGGCDEHIQLYFFSKTIPKKNLDALISKFHGNAAENELIKLHIIPESQVEDVIRIVGDVKAECAYNRVCIMKERGELPC